LENSKGEIIGVNSFNHPWVINLGLHYSELPAQALQMYFPNREKLLPVFLVVTFVQQHIDSGNIVLVAVRSKITGSAEKQ